MKTFLNSLLPHKRLFWFLLTLSAFLLEMIALFFQYGMDLQPCVLCIYQRCAIWGIFIAGIIGMIQPKWLIFRFIAFILWIYSAVVGLRFAFKLVEMQFSPSLFGFCPLRPDFPDFMPLDLWLPGLFQATGTCGERVWQFLSLEMSQWMIVIFVAYLVIIAITLLLSFYCFIKRRNRV